MRITPNLVIGLVFLIFSIFIVYLIIQIAFTAPSIGKGVLIGMLIISLMITVSPTIICLLNRDEDGIALSEFGGKWD
jgi:hypothetical protein